VDLSVLRRACASLQAPAHGHLNYSKEFVAEARLALLQEIGATPFNLVVSDYGWWTSMAMTRPGERFYWPTGRTMWSRML
jgi:hypothetical protein